MRRTAAPLVLLVVLTSLSHKVMGQNADENLFPGTEVGPMGAVPGQILLRLEDELLVPVGKTGTVSNFNIAAIDRIIDAGSGGQVRQLLIGEVFQPPQKKASYPTLVGPDIVPPNLHNLFLVTIEDASATFDVISQLTELPEVIYAEPNYLYGITDFFEVDTSSSPATPTASGIVPNDPLFGQQWGIGAVNLDVAWETTTGSSDQIIAIIDTGVDWTHPDLDDKIWINNAELNGIEGVDDDRNGFVDDIRGWDFINNDNDPSDDNSHGTHVAGIAAAESNNGIGIAGASWGAKILPIKAFQSTGRSDVATIAQAINYARSQGVTVINMSFGSSSRSLVMEDALAAAYGGAVLIASAGNNGQCVGPGMFCGRSYPAAISFVLGVEASKRTMLPCKIPGPFTSRACFSNYDQDGPFYSGYPELNNYELRAPGSGIISTIPGGGYREYSGTSMAAPLVAGIAAIIKGYETQPMSQEQLWIRLIDESLKVLDAERALTTTETAPRIVMLSFAVDDALSGDGDGRVDAGEKVRLEFELKNVGGIADSVQIEIGFAEFEDRTTATFIDSSATVGSISSYARRMNEASPIELEFNPNLANLREVGFVLSGTPFAGGSALQSVQTSFSLTVENGVEIGGLVADSLVLAAGVNYIVTENLYVLPGASLTLLPGSRLYFNPGKNLSVSGSFYSRGETGNMNHLTGREWKGVTINQDGHIDMRYTFVSDMLAGEAFSLMNGGSKQDTISDNIFSNNFSHWDFFRNIRYSPDPVIKRNVFTGNLIGSAFFFRAGNSGVIEDNIVSNNSMTSNNLRHHTPGMWLGDQPPNLTRNSVFGNKPTSGVANALTAEVYIISAPQNYWGTSKADIISDQTIDFFEFGELKPFIFEPFLTQPSDSAHGHVWKVLINGVDPQDEADQLEPIGTGKQRFDVYFNRAMDTSIAPVVSFGVRDPYTQTIVDEESSWSADSTIWTGYHTVELHTGDGINRVRVSEAKDTEGFEIPIEDTRFEFLVDAAGVSSTDFQATAGLGRVELTWRQPESLDDLLGYNVYRFENATDTTYTDTTRVNSALLVDSTFTDFSVTPGRNYYYQYTVLKTDFTESDYSGTVAAQPLTAVSGDANGDFSVNVLDVVSIVNHILGKAPAPFILEAADVNTDGAVNVLDLVATVNISLGVSKSARRMAKGGQESVTLRIAEGILTMESEEPVSGLELHLSGAPPELITFSESLSGFEVAKAAIGPDTTVVLIYQIGSGTLPLGSHDLLGVPQGASIISAIASNSAGISLEVSAFNRDEPLIPIEFTLDQNYPNPFNARTSIRYGVPVDVEGLTLEIFDLLGRRVRRVNLGGVASGFHTYQWDGQGDAGTTVASGIYFYQLRVIDGELAGLAKTGKMIMVK